MRLTKNKETVRKFKDKRRKINKIGGTKGGARKVGEQEENEELI